MKESENQSYPRVRITDWDSGQFDREILKSAVIAVTILTAVIGFLIVLFSALITVPYIMSEDLRGSFRAIAPKIYALLLLVGGYELGIRAWLLRLLDRNKLPPHFLRYLNAIIEISIPTVLMIILMQVVGPIQALNSAAPLIYFLFIFLAALQLDFKLCVFTSVVAALQFMALAIFALRSTASLPEWPLLTAPHQYMVRSILLMVGGLVVGFVANQIRQQFTVTLRTLQERDRAISIFGQHVSPEVAERLLHQPVDFGGETRKVCVMFLDIRNFSRFAGETSPEEVMSYLNTLFSGMIDVINRHRGIINKFLGDGFMAVFGAPVDDAELCEHAMDAAVAILSEVEILNERGDIPPTRVGIGLHMGEAVTGNVGSDQRKEYTIIGDVVNLASRIEQANKQFNSQLLVSEAVWSTLDQQTYEAEDLGKVELKGQAKPTRIYKIA